MARSLDQILAELNPYYDPSRKVVQSQLDAVPGETEAGIAQAEAKLGVANENILNGARTRGLGFSGIPVGEQAKYAATDFAPAVAGLKATGAAKATTLAQSLSDLQLKAVSQAQGIRDNEIGADQSAATLAEQQRQFDLSYALQKSAAAAASSSTAGIGAYLTGTDKTATTSAAKPPAQYGFNDGKSASSGFYFVNASGQPITAAQYATATNQPIINVIQMMAKAGDKTSAAILKNSNQVKTGIGQFNPVDVQRYSYILGGA
ncbi:hypothetical protein [Naasia lichenicola]|uniref:Uncharacterized protein n=1 Tax=Naasia lichenicola TaxID=2565933 RepID=A0A4S4FMZ6_9MICO|nr:hypothetical protein [Naasia lichenicola]THG30673.1 hypothetical protein E6C64_08515 [Naasia lichenicola]THG31910.1 hypothetical protein E6C64_07660 [Naasia lichenicola]